MVGRALPEAGLLCGVSPLPALWSLKATSRPQRATGWQGVFWLVVSEYVYVWRGEVGIPRCPLTIKHFISQTRPGGSCGRGDPHCPEVDLSHCWLPIALERSPHQGFRGWDEGGSPVPVRPWAGHSLL